MWLQKVAPRANEENDKKNMCGARNEKQKRLRRNTWITRNV